LYSTEEGKQAFKKSYTIAWVQYKKKFITNPILREYLNDNSALNSLSIIQQPQGTNFRVTREQWAELKKYPQISDFTRAGMMEDSEQIDWKNPDSHLSLIKNQNTLDRIN
jgi:hypothetical protein